MKKRGGEKGRKTIKTTDKILYGANESLFISLNGCLFYI